MNEISSLEGTEEDTNIAVNTTSQTTCQQCTTYHASLFSHLSDRKVGPSANCGVCQILRRLNQQNWPTNSAGGEPTGCIPLIGVDEAVVQRVYRRETTEHPCDETTSAAVATFALRLVNQNAKKVEDHLSVLHKLYRMLFLPDTRSCQDVLRVVLRTPSSHAESIDLSLMCQMWGRS